MMPPSRSPAEPPPHGPTDVAEHIAALAESVRSLRLTLTLTVVVLILVTMTVNVTLAYQLRSLRRQAGEVQTTARTTLRTIQDYETNSLPTFERFLVDLRKFGERNPDFAPILAPYLGDASGAKPTGAAPAPAPRNTPTPRK